MPVFLDNIYVRAREAKISSVNMYRKIPQKILWGVYYPHLKPKAFD